MPQAAHDQEEDKTYHKRIDELIEDAEIEAEIEIEKAGHQIATIRVTLMNEFGSGNDLRATLRNDNNREIASHRISDRFAIFENHFSFHITGFRWLCNKEPATAHDHRHCGSQADY